MFWTRLGEFRNASWPEAAVKAAACKQNLQLDDSGDNLRLIFLFATVNIPLTNSSQLYDV